jgi:hypothetical protein
LYRFIPKIREGDVEGFHGGMEMIKFFDILYKFFPKMDVLGMAWMRTISWISLLGDRLE